MAVAEVRPSIPPRTCPPLNAIPAPPPPPVLSRRAHLHKQPGIALQDLADARCVKDPQICNSKHCSYRCDLCQPTPPALGRSVTGCAVNAPGSAVCTVLTDQPRSSRDGDAVEGSPRWPGAEARSPHCKPALWPVVVAVAVVNSALRLTWASGFGAAPSFRGALGLVHFGPRGCFRRAPGSVHGRAHSGRREATAGVATGLAGE